MAKPKTYKAEDAIQSGYIMPDYVEYATGIMQDIGLPTIPIRDGRHCRSASFRIDPVAIVLPRWARTRKTILHEVAHYIEYYLWAKTGHGANFRICFEGLLSIYMPDKLKDYQKAMISGKYDLDIPT